MTRPSDQQQGPRVALLAPMTIELDPIVEALALEPAQLDGRTGLDGLVVHEGRIDRGPDRPPVEVLAVLIGMGTEPAAAATTALLAAVEVDHVIVVGVAGGVLPDATIGDLVVVDSVLHGPSGRRHAPVALGDVVAEGTMHTSDELVQDAEALDALRDDGVVALDMETAAVAMVCDALGVPWSVVRAVSDLAGDAAITAEVAAMTRPDGTPDLDAVTRYLAEDPSRVEVLTKLGHDVELAARTAAAAAIAACHHVGDPSSR